MNPGYIYIMEDQSNCNIVKVGYSEDPIQRLRQLYTTGTPLPYIITYLWGVKDMLNAERVAHAVLEGHRVNPNREFFYIVPPMSNLPGQYCPDTCDCYLYTLAGLIEERFSDCNIEAIPIDLNWFKQKYAERLQLFPEGVKGFT
ncbi:GIY-YIG nuclease family protein [Vibrio parahaemolyticus]|uniref:GIY-YIG nuclease family protein n=1 Tax=Vibrio parahaemolyticus TaxID=670 RepID=UPI00224F1B85|nr:GIY-YIG nuclease family protein [Vibrio parahaemolyticus]MCX4122088.1 GIY-YIG nuclease family protein [Vibrio parahaemolyticus]